MPCDALEIRAVARDEVLERIAAELLECEHGELPRDRRLRDDGKGFDGGDVRALDERCRALPGLAADRGGRRTQGRQRLHHRPHDYLLAVRDPCFDPTGMVRVAA